MTINIRKSHIQVVDFLERNKDKKVKDILDELKQLVALKVQTKTHISNPSGEVVAVFCYYHKQWELVSETDYGKKASSTTGLNTMCKVGTREWTKQNNRVKAIGSTILEMLTSGKLETTDIEDKKAELTLAAKVINTDEMPKGYSLEELKEIFDFDIDEVETSED